MFYKKKNISMVQQVNVFEHKCSEYASLVDFLRQQGIRAQWWPAKCPDTSPTEHILDILGCRVQQTPALKQFATAVEVGIGWASQEL